MHFYSPEDLSFYPDPKAFMSEKTYIDSVLYLISGVGGKFGHLLLGLMYSLDPEPDLEFIYIPKPLKYVKE